jgi:hypothetical protein
LTEASRARHISRSRGGGDGRAGGRARGVLVGMPRRAGSVLLLLLLLLLHLHLDDEGRLLARVATPVTPLAAATPLPAAASFVTFLPAARVTTLFWLAPVARGARSVGRRVALRPSAAGPRGGSASSGPGHVRLYHDGAALGGFLWGLDTEGVNDILCFGCVRSNCRSRWSA